MRISDWSSDVCSSDLKPAANPSREGSSTGRTPKRSTQRPTKGAQSAVSMEATKGAMLTVPRPQPNASATGFRKSPVENRKVLLIPTVMPRNATRSEEHTSETPVTNAHLVCRLLLAKKKIHKNKNTH